MIFRNRPRKLGMGERMADAGRFPRPEPLAGGVVTPARQDSFDSHARESMRLRRLCHATETVAG
jgi:hypothetical protein